MRSHVHSSDRANEAIHDTGPVLRCVRCGALDEDSRPFCRDDHDHRWLPQDHWLNRRWRTG